MTFPEDYQAAHLAGKDAVFEVTVHELREKGESAIDDELATRLGFEDLAGLRDAVAGQINGQHATALRQAVKKNVLDALSGGEAFGIPPSLHSSNTPVSAHALTRCMRPACGKPLIIDVPMKAWMVKVNSKNGAGRRFAQAPAGNPGGQQYRGGAKCAGPVSGGRRAILAGMWCWAFPARP